MAAATTADAAVEKCVDGLSRNICDLLHSVISPQPTREWKEKLIRDFRAVLDKEERSLDGPGHNPEYHPGFTQFDLAYVDLLDRIGQLGNVKPCRQGGTTRSLHAQQIRVQLIDEEGAPVLPYLHCKRIPWVSVMTELQWFLQGNTNALDLKEKGSGIWLDDAKKHRERMKAKGEPAPAEGDLGPIYGKQWNAPTHDADAEMSQVVRAIQLLATDPFSRRIVVDSWSPGELHQMAVPPCHFAFQFTCTKVAPMRLKVNCSVTMRSTDVGLGLPFNVMSYAMLTHLVCHEAQRRRQELGGEAVSYVAGELVITMGDCHLYDEHQSLLEDVIPPVKSYVSGNTSPAPKVPSVRLEREQLSFRKFLDTPPQDFCEECFHIPEEWGEWRPPRIPLPLLT